MGGLLHELGLHPKASPSRSCQATTAGPDNDHHVCIVMLGHVISSFNSQRHLGPEEDDRDYGASGLVVRKLRTNVCP